MFIVLLGVQTWIYLELTILEWGSPLDNRSLIWNGLQIFYIILNVWLFLVTWLKALLFRYQWWSLYKLVITTSHIALGILKFECLVWYIIGESISCLIDQIFHVTLHPSCEYPPHIFNICVKNDQVYGNSGRVLLVNVGEKKNSYPLTNTALASIFP